MDCSISPILLTAAFEIILIGGRQRSEHSLPAQRSYMDDVTTLLQTAACTTPLLKRLKGAPHMSQDENQTSQVLQPLHKERCQKVIGLDD